MTSIKEDKTGYTPSAGIDSLREKILKKHKFAESAIITSGVAGGLFLTYSALLEEGDELIVFDPYFVVYPDMCKFINAVPVIVKTKDDFSIDFTALEKAITKKTKAILINTPNNPSGHVCGKDEMQKIAEIAKKHDLWIISDEVYEDFDFEDKFVSAGSFHEKTIVLSGFSKNFAMTGLRVGFAAGPKKIIDDMVKLQQYTFVCAPSISQHAVDENFNLDVSKLINVFKKRSDIVFDKLSPHLNIIKPEGAFYCFIKLPDGITGTEFSEKCLEKGVLVVPGAAFSEKDDHFRLCFTVDEEKLKKGLDIIVEIVKELK
jgi:aspartate aminotransferase/aminotransferase